MWYSPSFVAMLFGQASVWTEVGVLGEGFPPSRAATIPASLSLPLVTHNGHRFSSPTKGSPPVSQKWCESMDRGELLLRKKFSCPGGRAGGSGSGEGGGSFGSAVPVELPPLGSRAVSGWIERANLGRRQRMNRFSVELFWKGERIRFFCCGAEMTQMSYYTTAKKGSCAFPTCLTHSLPAEVWPGSHREGLEGFRGSRHASVEMEMGMLGGGF